MMLVGRQLILPAALRHQTVLAQNIHSVEAVGGDAKATRAYFKEYTRLVNEFTETLEELRKADSHHDEDATKHATWMKQKVVPLMERLRDIGDHLEGRVPADQWPLPSYRELLFIK
jgi:glutamine synthetase